MTPVEAAGKKFCPLCESEVVEVSETPAGRGRGALIRDGMGMIEENRTKIGAVETFSDNSVTNNTTNITQISDDTKKSVVCEISGKKVLVTSSVCCPVCGRTVAEQYYLDEKLRCTACDSEAVSSYESFYANVTSGARTIDAGMRQALDAKARELKLDVAQIKETEARIRQSQTGLAEKLSDMQQRDFDRTIRQFKEEKAKAASCLEKVAVYAKLTSDDQVHCWYRLLSAIVSPEGYLKDMKNADVDNYWQHYWAFVAFARTKNVPEALVAIETVKSKYPENSNDVMLSQVALEVHQYKDTKDESYLSDAVSDLNSIGETESACLSDFLAYFKNVVNVSRQVKVEPVRISVKSGSDAPVPVKPSSSDAVRSGNTDTSVVSKGYVIDPVKKKTEDPPVVVRNKKSPVGWIVAAVAVVAVVVCAVLFMGKSGKDDVPTMAEQAVASKSAEFKAADSKDVQEVSDAKAPMAEKKPVSMAQTAAEKSGGSMAQKSMAEKAAASSPSSSASAKPMNDVYVSGMDAYSAGDYKKAYDLFQKAGNAGNADACYQLGLMLSTGKGSISRNVLQAKTWLKKAVAGGNADAQRVLDSL